jgi:hypothetical protein
MKLRAKLYLMVAGVLAPMIVFVVTAVVLLVKHERETIERDAIGRARAAMTAVDAHLRASIVSLETLAASRNLEAGDLQAFHAESQRVLRTQPGWVNIGLISKDQRQLADAVYAYGKAADLPADDDSLRIALTGRNAVGDLAVGAAVRSQTVRVRVPVKVGEEVRYVLSAPLNLKGLGELLQAQRLPEDWVIALVDREKRVIVRIPAVPAGTPASETMRQAIERAPEGFIYGRTLEGKQTYMPYVTSPLSGWVLSIAIPAALVDAGARRTFIIVAMGLLVAVAIGALLAWAIAQRSNPPVH